MRTRWAEGRGLFYPTQNSLRILITRFSILLPIIIRLLMDPEDASLVFWEIKWVRITKSLQWNQNTPKPHHRAEEIGEKLMGLLPRVFLTKIDGSKIWESRNQREELVSNCRHHLEDAWKCILGTTPDDHMVSPLSTHFANLFMRNREKLFKNIILIGKMPLSLRSMLWIMRMHRLIKLSI